MLSNVYFNCMFCKPARLGWWDGVFLSLYFLFSQDFEIVQMLRDFYLWSTNHSASFSAFYFTILFWAFQSNFTACFLYWKEAIDLFFYVKSTCCGASEDSTIKGKHSARRKWEVPLDTWSPPIYPIGYVSVEHISKLGWLTYGGCIHVLSLTHKKDFTVTNNFSQVTILPNLSESSLHRFHWFIENYERSVFGLVPKAWPLFLPFQMLIIPIVLLFFTNSFGGAIETAVINFCRFFLATQCNDL